MDALRGCNLKREITWYSKWGPELLGDIFDSTGLLFAAVRRVAKKIPIVPIVNHDPQLPGGFNVRHGRCHDVRLEGTP